MKKILNYLIPALIVLSSISVAQAQSSNPNYWKTNVPSSTITPLNSSLKVPCANIVGGCSGISTSTTNTFSVPQNFNGISNTGNVTSTSITTGSSTAISTANNLNTVLQIPWYFSNPFIGCPWNTSLTDFGGCANAAYNSVSSTASSVVIVAPTGQISYTTGINFGNLGELGTLVGQGNGTQLTYTGASSTPAITINDSQTNGSTTVHFQSVCLADFTLTGASATTTNPTTGIQLGGTNGASHCLGENLTVSTFGNDIDFASNTYDATIAFSTIKNGGHDVVVNGYANSGETDELLDDWTVDNGNNSSTNCILLSNGSNENFAINGGSVDDCQANFSQNNTNVVQSNVNHENPGWATYGSYPFVVVATGTVLTDYGSQYQNDASTTGKFPAEFVSVGGHFYFYGDVAIRNNSTNATSIAEFAAPTTGNQSNIYDYGLENVNNGVNSAIGGDTLTAGVAAANQLITGATIGGWSFDMMANTANQGYFVDGNQDIGSTDNNGNWIFGSGSGGGYASTSTPKVASTTVQVAGTASSSLRIGLSGSNEGCLEVYTSGGSLTYTYASASTTLTTTTTKPAFCE